MSVPVCTGRASAAVARGGLAIGRGSRAASQSLDGWLQHPGRGGENPLMITNTQSGTNIMDDLLAEHGLSRRIALTVPSFLWALTVIADGDLVGTLPRTLVRVHGARFGVAALEPPLPFGATRVRAVATRAAMADAGVAWLVELIQREAPAAQRTPPRRGVRAGRASRR